MLYGRFIDEYLETYKSLSGQSAARNRLVKEIMATAGTRAALESADIAAVAVKKRLANTLAKTNKKHRAAIDLDPEEPALRLAGRWPGMPSKISYKPSSLGSKNPVFF